MTGVVLPFPANADQARSVSHARRGIVPQSRRAFDLFAKSFWAVSCSHRALTPKVALWK